MWLHLLQVRPGRILIQKHWGPLACCYLYVLRSHSPEDIPTHLVWLRFLSVAVQPTMGSPSAMSPYKGLTLWSGGCLDAFTGKPTPCWNCLYQHYCSLDTFD